MSFEQAAAIPQAGMLALQGIMAGNPIEPGQSILINGAGGGVGSIAIQLLKQHQVEVTGVDSAVKLEAMRSWGFDHVIDYREQDFTRNTKCYDLILDAKTDRSPGDYERVLNPQRGLRHRRWIESQPAENRIVWFAKLRDQRTKSCVL